MSDEHNPDFVGIQEKFKYLRIKNIADYQDEVLKLRHAPYIKQSVDLDEDPQYSKLSFHARETLSCLRRKWAKLRCNPPNDTAWIIRASLAGRRDAAHVPHSVRTLVAQGFLTLSNEKDDFAKLPNLTQTKQTKQRDRERQAEPVQSDTPPEEKHENTDAPPEHENQSDSVLASVPEADRPRKLARILYALLGEPKHYKHDLPQWAIDLQPVLERHDFIELATALRWALKEGTRWPQFIRRAENVVKNADKIVDDFRASQNMKVAGKIAGKKAREAVQQEQSSKKQAPSNYGGGLPTKELRRDTI